MKIHHSRTFAWGIACLIIATLLAALMFGPANAADGSQRGTTDATVIGPLEPQCERWTHQHPLWSQHCERNASGGNEDLQTDCNCKPGTKPRPDKPVKEKEKDRHDRSKGKKDHEQKGKKDNPKDNASEHNGEGGNDGRGGKTRDGSKNSDRGKRTDQ